MDTLIDVLISGMAVAYTVELLISLTRRFVPASFVKATMTLPLGILSVYLLGNYGWSLIIYGLAASCVALIVVFFVNRPTTNQVITTRR